MCASGIPLIPATEPVPRLEAEMVDARLAAIAPILPPLPPAASIDANPDVGPAISGPDIGKPPLALATIPGVTDEEFTAVGMDELRVVKLAIAGPAFALARPLPGAPVPTLPVMPVKLERAGWLKIGVLP